MPVDGRLVIISGPSGAGKSTVVKRLLESCSLPLMLSVSATTRKPRPAETEGVNYHFLTHEEFAERREADEFLECKEVFGRGDWYGTLRNETQAALADGKWLILEIDVQGAAAVIPQRPEAITIFLHPGSAEELERRLRSRGTETEESIQRRLEVANAELACMGNYRHPVVNDTIDRAVREICDILMSYAGDSSECWKN